MILCVSVKKLKKADMSHVQIIDHFEGATLN